MRLWVLVNGEQTWFPVVKIMPKSIVIQLPGNYMRGIWTIPKYFIGAVKLA